MSTFEQREIKTPAEADELTSGAVILINDIAALQRTDKGQWVLTGANGYYAANHLLPEDWFPATLVAQPDPIEWTAKLHAQLDAYDAEEAARHERASE